MVRADRSAGHRWRSALVGIWVALVPVLTAEAQAPSQNALSGSRLFASKRCFACHSINGFGGTEAPDLANTGELRSFYDLAAAMWNHVPDMTRRMRGMRIDPPHLDPWEAGDLAAFLFWLGYFDPSGEEASGERIFLEKGCVTCHQVRGVGGVVGPNLDFMAQFGAPIQMAAAMWNHGPAMIEELARRGIPQPTFTGSELVDLIAFIEMSDVDAPGGPLYVLPGRVEEGLAWYRDKNCLECHGTPGSGGRIGPDLAARARSRSLIQFAAAMWNKGPAMMRVMRSSGIEIPKLSPAEMADIVAYLYSVQYFRGSGRIDRGRRLLAEKRCLGCHALAGRGGTTAQDLTQARGLNSPAAVMAALWNHIEVPLSEEDLQSWRSITSAEITDLSAFLQTVGRR